MTVERLITLEKRYELVNKIKCSCNQDSKTMIKCNQLLYKLRMKIKIIKNLYRLA